MQYILTIPELCAEHDQGGGVACGDDFIVFTRAQLPDSYLTYLGEDQDLEVELTEAALAVELLVNFYMSREDLGGQGLRSLPHVENKTHHQLDQNPWFFLNAAKVDPRGIGIAGRGDTIGGTLVETLLAVLSRPWCVLELCFSTTKAIDALLDFAYLACQLDAGAYTAARILLSHERAHRLFSGLDVRGSGLVESMMLSKPVRRHKANMREIRELCAALFIVSESSYSGFWMRAICVCALRLDLSVSVFGSSLSDSTGAYTQVMRSENLLHWAVERQFDNTWTATNDHQIPVYEERIRAGVLKDCFSSLLTLFSQELLPGLYQISLHEIMELMV